MAESKLHIRAARGNLDQAHDILIGDREPIIPEDLSRRDLSEALALARLACNQLIQAQVARGLEERDDE